MVALRDETVDLICTQAVSIVKIERKIYEEKIKAKMENLLKQENIDPSSWQKFLPPDY